MTQVVTTTPSLVATQPEQTTWTPQVGEQVFITAVWSKHYGARDLVVQLKSLAGMPLADVKLPDSSDLWEVQYSWLASNSNPPPPVPESPTIESPVACEPDVV